ncbi:hypothetical protein HAX39_22415 [Citrobacter freundii]|nr:hypothetical protein [Citrobacter freundii]
MKKSFFFLPLLLFLAGCPGKGREGAESGERRAIYVDGNRVCFTIDKYDVLNRYILSTNGREDKKLLVGDFKHLTYPSTCFTVNLEKGVVYGASYTLNGKNHYYTFIITNDGKVLDLGKS